jgi:hypothetical protein
LSVYRRYEVLSSGQCLAMYVKRKRITNGCSAWIVSVCIFPTKRECDYWFRNQDKVVEKSRSSKGIEGLMLAARWLKELKRMIRRGDKIVIFWTDGRRHSAFRYLKRFGFREGVAFDRPCYYLDIL